MGAGPGAILQSLRVQGPQQEQQRQPRPNGCGQRGQGSPGSTAADQRGLHWRGWAVGWKVRHPPFPLLRRPRVSWLKTGAAVSQRHRGRTEGRWVGKPAGFRASAPSSCCLTPQQPLGLQPPPQFSGSPLSPWRGGGVAGKRQTQLCSEFQDPGHLSPWGWSALVVLPHLLGYTPAKGRGWEDEAAAETGSNKARWSRQPLGLQLSALQSVSLPGCPHESHE